MRSLRRWMVDGSLVGVAGSNRLFLCRSVIAAAMVCLGFQLATGQETERNALETSFDAILAQDTAEQVQADALAAWMANSPWQDLMLVDQVRLINGLSERSSPYQRFSVQQSVIAKWRSDTQALQSETNQHRDRMRRQAEAERAENRLRILQSRLERAEQRGDTRLAARYQQMIQRQSAAESVAE